MLTRLSVRNFAVATHSELELGSGLTVISGETGAGKSLLVDAMGFLSGQRADSGMVRHGTERAELDAEFDLSGNERALRWLQDYELSDEDQQLQCQIRRTLRADGGSKAWINGRVVTLQQLTDLCGTLVEIHGQHEHQNLLSRPGQLRLLDAYGRHTAELDKVSDAARHWQHLQQERNALIAKGDLEDRKQWLRYQIDELQSVAIDPSAIDELVQQHKRHANSTELITGYNAALSSLSGDSRDGNIVRSINTLKNKLDKLQEFDPKLAQVTQALDAALIQLDEASAQLDRMRSEVDIDPGQFEQLEQQLSRLHDVSRKHRISPEQLTGYLETLSTEFEQIDQAQDRLADLDQAIDTAYGEWKKHADHLSKKRVQSAKTLAKTTTELLDELGMQGGQFLVELEDNATSTPDPLGNERVEFLVTANAGQPPRPLRRVASGGELSRISLAIEVAALGMDDVPTMIFDEVDSGIGGATADIVGQKLRALAAKRQVLCVTHLPQVAAQGHQHFHVSKALVNGATESRIQKLDAKQRQNELARMLGGTDMSKEAVAAAKQLLQRVK